MAEPANRQTNQAGGKYYLHPVTDEKFDSVTTALDVIGKSALKIWAGMVAADMAFDLLPQMTTAMLQPLCGNTFNRCYQKHGASARCDRCPCGVCEKCIWRRIAWRHAAESARRADEGHQFHEAAQFWVNNGGKETSIPPEIVPYWQAFLRFVHDYGLHPDDWLASEITMINREHMYAGTSDAVVRILRERSALAAELCDLVGPKRDEVLVRIDYKSREKGDEQLYDDMPLQGVAYDRCTVGLLPNGNEYELPKTDLCAILQLRPVYVDGQISHGVGEYSFKPMVVDDVTFSTFLQSLAIYRWIGNEGKKAFDLGAVAASVQARQVRELDEAVTVVADLLGATQRVDEDGFIVIDLPSGEPPSLDAQLASELGEVLDLADQAVETHLTPERVEQALAAVKEQAVEIPAFEDPWAVDPIDQGVQPDPWPSPAPPSGSLADLKAHGDAHPAPAKKATKRAPAKKTAKKSATADVDPFDLARTDASATLASLKDFDPGKPVTSALGDEIPF